MLVGIGGQEQIVPQRGRPSTAECVDYSVTGVGKPERDFSDENQAQSESKNSDLTHDQQVKFATLVMQNGCSHWKPICDQFDLKNHKEAILEFMRLP